jgi:hypothetical protein
MCRECNIKNEFRRLALRLVLSAKKEKINNLIRKVCGIMKIFKFFEVRYN